MKLTLKTIISLGAAYVEGKLGAGIGIFAEPVGTAFVSILGGLAGLILGDYIYIYIYINDKL